MKRCPVCYEAMNTVTGVCRYCGFNENDLYDTSNELVPKMRELDPTTIIETNILPEDVSRKKLIKYVFLLGLFGGHLFYIHKNKKAMFYLISTILMIVLLPFEFQVIVLPINPVLLSTFGSVPFAITILCWLTDVMNILIKKFGQISPLVPHLCFNLNSFRSFVSQLTHFSP